VTVLDYTEDYSADDESYDAWEGDKIAYDDYVNYLVTNYDKNDPERIYATRCIDVNLNNLVGKEIEGVKIETLADANAFLEYAIFYELTDYARQHYKELGMPSDVIVNPCAIGNGIIAFMVMSESEMEN